MVSESRKRIVFRSIKSALKKGSEVEYWAMRMYEQQAAGVLDDAQIAELEEIVEAYYDAQERAAMWSEPVELEDAEQPIDEGV